MSTKGAGERVKRRGRWSPGVSGNPRGRPRKEECFAELIRAIAPKEEIVRRLISIALGEVEDAGPGDQLAAMKLLLNYTDGLPRARTEVTVPADVITLAMLDAIEPVEP